MKTTLPFLKLFSSDSNYFDQNPRALILNREIIKTYLKDVKGYSDTQTDIYLKAYDYFMANPLNYDGATMTEDLFDIENLELSSMLHDYLYLEHKVAGNYKYRLLADKLFRSEMRKMNKSSWNRGARYVLLILASFVFQHTAYCFLFKNRRMTEQHKADFDGVLAVLSHKTPKVWYKEFKGELTFLLFLIVLIIFVIY